MRLVNRFVLVLVAVGCLLTIGACGGARLATQVAGSSSRTYRDSAGWTVSVPAGWHVVRFHESSDGITAAGALISNVRLAAPPVVSGYPIQVNARVLTGRGVGLIVASGKAPKMSPGALVTPPLPSPDGPEHRWSIGSALAGDAFLETLWFRVGGRTFVASAKVGPNVSSADRHALATIIRSLR